MRNRYLTQKHNNTISFHCRIPKSIKHLYDNKAHLFKSLMTSDMSIARIRRDQLLAVMNEQVAAMSGNDNALFNHYVATLRDAKTNATDFYDNHTAIEILDDNVGSHELQLQASALVERNVTPDKFKLSLQGCLDTFNEHHIDHKSKKYMTNINRTCTRYIETFPERSLDSTSRKMIVAYIDTLLTSFKPTTIKDILFRLSTVYNFAFKLGMLEVNRNPFNDHHLRLEPVKQKQLFSRDLLRILIDWSKSDKCKYGLLIELGLYTGARISELCALRNGDITTNEYGMVTMTISAGKTPSAIRCIPLPDVIAERVRLMASSSDSDKLLFKGGLASIGTYISKYKVENITNDTSITFHSLRVNQATALQRSGCSDWLASKVLGHKSTGSMSFSYYAKVDVDAIHEVINKSADMVAELWL